MKRLSAMWLLLLILLSGCMHTRLQCQSTRQGSTLTNIHERQVLDNLAKFCVNPGELPSFIYADGGSTQSGYNSRSNLALTWNPTTLTTESAGIDGTLTAFEGWTFKTVNAPEKLALMKCVYQYATCRASEDYCSKCTTSLIRYFGDDFAQCEIPVGWFEVTDKKPRGDDCCRKFGYYCGTYVVVRAENYECLSRLTMSILDIATVDIAALTAQLNPAPAAEPAKDVTIQQTFKDALGQETFNATFQVTQAEFEAMQKDGKIPKNFVAPPATERGPTDVPPFGQSSPLAPIIKRRFEYGPNLENLYFLGRD